MLQYCTDQTVTDTVRILKEYNMIEHINSFRENGIVMSKSEWKKIVNDKVKHGENKVWTATSLLYRGLNDFKSTGINLKRGCPWWEVENWGCSLLWKIKLMWILLVTNNSKSGYNFHCVSAPNVGQTV